MTVQFDMISLADLLRQSNVYAEIDPEKSYRLVTVKLWGKGVELRSEVEGTSIIDAKLFVARENQFILSKIDARNGAFGLIPPQLDRSVVSTDFPIFELNTEKILPDYLNWMSKTKEFVHLCAIASEGTTNRVRLKIDRFLASRISLPSIEEQRHIVARIEELAAKIEEARGLRREAVEETGVLIDAGLDRVFNNLSRKTRSIVFGAAGGFVTSGPRGWGNYYNENGRRRLIRVENVTDNVVDLSLASKVEIPSDEGDIERSQVQINDVLVTITGAIGRVGIVTEFDMPCHVSQHVALMRAPQEIYPHYLYWYLRSPIFGRSQTEGKTYGATKPGINLTNLRTISIITPSINEQYDIVAYFNGLQAKIYSLKQQQSQTSAELNALLPSILDKAFKGEL